jgi:hypothetical protein
MVHSQIYSSDASGLPEIQTSECSKWAQNSNKTGSVRVTQHRGARETVLAMGRQYVLHILCVCV